MLAKHKREQYGFKDLEHTRDLAAEKRLAGLSASYSMESPILLCFSDTCMSSIGRKYAFRNPAQAGFSLYRE